MEHLAAPETLKAQSWASYKNKKWVLQPFDERLYLHLKQVHNLNDLVARLLAQQNIQVSEAAAYLSPKLKDWIPPPSCLKNLLPAVDRLYQAFQNCEKVIVFGDYDVDGATSTALLINFFRKLDYSVDFYIPDRLTEGYGPSISAFEKIHQKGTSLIITVDCGTTAVDALAYAHQQGMDVIVVDHHACTEVPSLPQTLIINPNQPTDTSGLTYLCAVGVTFMMLIGFVQKLKETAYPHIPDLREFLDLVALGTVCDVAPLIKLNRAFVRQGMEVFKRCPNLGIRTLAQVAGINSPLEAYHLGFILGPHINAGGRLQDSSLGVQLLTTSSQPKAFEIATQLGDLNKARQNLEANMLSQAMEQASRQATQVHSILCVHSTEWHPGVIGIIASRLKDHFEKPVCVISFDEEGYGKGSARSVKGLHLGHLMLEAHKKNILLSGGGHAMAAGFSLQKEHLDSFMTYLTEHTFENLEDSFSSVHALLSISGATLETVELIDQLGPFGVNNPKPKILIPYVYVDFIQVRGQNHLACTLKSEEGARLEAIAFRSKDTPLAQAFNIHKSTPCHMVGTLKIDHWQGRKKVIFLIEDCIAA